MRRLVFASAPAGLVPGRSGYCTVARSPGLRERLVRELELNSAHEPGEGECFAFRVVSVSGENFAVITRFDDAGPDYTGRASTIAEHLVFEFQEIPALPPPADIARRYTGWLRRWEGAPRLLEDSETPAFDGAAATLPAATWKRLAGDAGKAAIFCDDSGRATQGVFPAPGGVDTLALFAEASLLLEDRGWNTPFTTRSREPDAWAVWRASTAVGFSALREPGLARRATLARSGVMAGPRPGTPAATPATPRSAAAKSYPKNNHTPVAAPTCKSNAGVFVAAGGVTVAVCGLAAFLFLRSGPPPAPEPTPEPTTTTVTPVPAPSPKAHPLVAEALVALGDGDTVKAARTWLALKATSPAEADAHRADILPPVRDRLVPATIERLRKKFADAVAPFGTEDSALTRELITELPRLAAGAGAPVTASDEAALAEFSATLDLMAKLDAALPVCSVVVPKWTKVNETALAATTATGPAEAPDIKKFLSASHTAMRVTMAPFEGFTGSPAKPVFTADVTARDFAPGRLLAVSHPEYKLLLELSLDARGRLTVTRRHPLGAPEAFRILGGDAPMVVTLEDTATRQKIALILADPGAGSPSSIVVPSAALTEKDGVVAPPAWLVGAVGRIRCEGAKPALLPFGYNGEPRDFPGFAADRAVVGQALGARIAALRAKSGSPEEIRRLEAALAGLPRRAVAAGKPWRIVIAPPGEALILPIIRFD